MHATPSPEDFLRSCKLKVTPSRRRLILALQSSPHLTIEQLHASLASKNAKPCDLATIYRNVDAFEKAGILARCQCADGVQRFALREKKGHASHHHHHVICRSCHRVDAIDECDLSAWLNPLKAMGYSRIEHSFEFSGLCRVCAR